MMVWADPNPTRLRRKSASDVPDQVSTHQVERRLPWLEPMLTPVSDAMVSGASARMHGIDTHYAGKWLTGESRFDAYHFFVACWGFASLVDPVSA
jgi:hypothetical protein